MSLLPEVTVNVAELVPSSVTEVELGEMVMELTCCTTVPVAVPLTPSADAVIVTVPAETPANKPEELNVATVPLVLEFDKDQSRPLVICDRLLLVSVPHACNCWL